MGTLAITYWLGYNFNLQPFGPQTNSLSIRQCLLFLPYFFPILVKEEPDTSEKKQEAKGESMFRPPPLPEPDVLSKLLESCNEPKDVELFFMQLPDSLPGQPPTTEVRQTKTEIQTESGQSLLLKTDSEVSTLLSPLYIQLNDSLTKRPFLGVFCLYPGGPVKRDRKGVGKTDPVGL